jgi:hypothetical protein
MKAFWNDEEGLTLLEFIALWVMVLWGICMLVVAIMAFILFIKGQDMSRWWLEYIDVFADVPVAVVIGLYGQGAFGKIGESIAGLRQSRSDMSNVDESGEYIERPI